MAYRNEQADIPTEQEPSPEQLVNRLEASFVAGDLPAAVEVGHQLLGLREPIVGHDSVYIDRPVYPRSGVRDDGHRTMGVQSIGTDRSDLFGMSSKDPVVAWRNAYSKDETSSDTIGAMQSVLRYGLGQFGWHYSQDPQYRNRGQLVGVGFLGSDLQMRVAAPIGDSAGREHIVLTGFMHDRGYVRADKTKAPLLQWAEGPEYQGTDFGMRIHHLLYADSKELSSELKATTNTASLAMDGLRSVRPGEREAQIAELIRRDHEVYGTTPPITYEQAAAEVSRRVYAGGSHRAR